MSAASPETLWVYVGTYTNIPPHARGRATGITTYRLDLATGALTLASTAPGIVNPSFLALGKDGSRLYAVNETPEFDGMEGGGVSAFAIDRATGALTLLNHQSSRGNDPCHIAIDRTGKAALVANYTSGSVALLRIRDDGGLEPASAFHQHAGSSVDPRRQTGPHAHAITPDPTNRYALAADLGLDRVLVYRLDPGKGELTPHEPTGVAFHPGAGPRQLAFHPNGSYVYVINELDSTMTVCAWDGERGTARPFQTISTLPPGFTGATTCAAVAVAPSGRFVYGSNRGHDSIASFAVDPATGLLTATGHTATGGRTPRGFAIDPTGQYLLAGNQDTDTIVTFRLDPATGQLTPTGQVVNTPSPICILIAPHEASLEDEPNPS